MQLVDRADNQYEIYKKNYRTRDIMHLVNEVVQTPDDRDDTRELAKRFAPTKEGLEKLFYYVANKFEYQEDADHAQWVQTPAYFFKNGKGDCKSFTVFIASVLYNMGLDRIIRYVSYGGRNYTHVYPIAILPNGKHIVMDVVLLKQQAKPFGSEKRYRKKKDFYMKTPHTAGLFKLGGLDVTIEELENAMRDIPDSIVHEGVGDVTEMTGGEFDKMIMRERLLLYKDIEINPILKDQYDKAITAINRGSVAGIAGIHTEFRHRLDSFMRKTDNDRAPAFKSFDLIIPAPPESEIDGIGTSARRNCIKHCNRTISAGRKRRQCRRACRSEFPGFIERAADAVKALFKKFINWLIKGPVKRMAPYFLFLFTKKRHNSEVARRKAQQKKTFNFINKAGQFSGNRLMALLHNGIIEQTGQTPDQLITNGTKGIAGIGSATAIVAAVLKAISVVIEVVKKIINLFKKNKSDAGDISKENASDIDILKEQRLPQGNGSPDQEGGGGLAIAAGLAALAYFAV